MGLKAGRPHFDWCPFLIGFMLIAEYQEDTLLFTIKVSDSANKDT